MATRLSLEARFWSKVWRCDHPYPCSRCCWPWLPCDLSVNWPCIWDQHGVFHDPRLTPQPSLAAPRCAYEFSTASLTFHSRAFHTCHQCSFAPCCNPLHLVLGSPSDNARDCASASPTRAITLPDGRRWSYADAVLTFRCFQDALEGHHVWAGLIPRALAALEGHLAHAVPFELRFPH